MSAVAFRAQIRGGATDLEAQLAEHDRAVRRDAFDVSARLRRAEAALALGATDRALLDLAVIGRIARGSTHPHAQRARALAQSLTEPGRTG